MYEAERSAQEGPSGWLFDVRRFSLHDGPGIRTTVFLKGCPLRCSWCHNPESQSPHAQLLHRHERCLHCGACLQACTVGAIERDGEQLRTDPAACDLCGACADACPAEARVLVGREASVGEVLRELERDRVFYDESGGGATLSGGEPLAQPAFTRALLHGCRERGIHTALDTAGYADADVLLDLAAHADLVLYDLKHTDADAHRRGTGVSNDVILANLRRLLTGGHDVIVRIPLVPGFNDAPADLQATAAFLATLDPLPPVQLLPFHAAATAKYTRFGLRYPHAGSAPQTPAQLEAAKGGFERVGVPVRVGG